MAFPNMLYGPEGEQFTRYALNSTTNRSRWPWGTEMAMQDGRKFRFGNAGGVALVAGDLQQARVVVANHVLQTAATAGAVGDRSLAVTLGATAAAINDYADGFLVIELGTGFGYAYPIAEHAAVLSAGTFTVPFKEGVSLQVAVPTTANTVSLISNPYYLGIVYPTTPTGVPIGVAQKPLTATTTAATNAGWFQIKGLGAVTTQGTVVVGNTVVPSGTTAGSVSPFVLTEGTPNTGGGQIVVGMVAHVATTTNKSTIMLNLP